MSGARTRRSRSTAGKAAEAALKKELLRHGFTVMPTGQENWLPHTVHAALRDEHTDPMARAVRYMPDFLADHPHFPLAFWDSKANKTPNTPHFAVEKTCLEEQLARIEKGERVVLAFWDTDRLWYASWADRLAVAHDMSGVRQRAAGSRTPYLLVRKSSTLPLEAFLRRHWTARWRGPVN